MKAWEEKLEQFGQRINIVIGVLIFCFMIISSAEQISAASWPMNTLNEKKTFAVDVVGDGEVIGGNTIETAGLVTYGETYSVHITKNTDDKNCYNKLIVNEKGIVTFRITKPKDSAGSYQDLDLILLDQNGNNVWKADTDEASSAYNYYECRIGLESGIYYFNIKSGFTVRTGTFTCKYYFNYEANQYYETEANNAIATADLIQSGVVYGANVFYSPLEYNDFFKYQAQAGESISIYLYDYEDLQAAGTFSIRMSTELGNQSTTGFYAMKYDETLGVYIYTFKAPSTGTYYIETISFADNPVEYRIAVKVGESNYTGLRQSADGNWYLYINGMINTSYNGLYCDANIGWWYVRDGKVDFGYTGLIQHYDAWFYIEGGRLNWDYTGLVQHYGAWFFVECGQLNWGYTGLTLYNNEWFYVENGQLNWNYIGLTMYNNEWFYVEGGRLNWNYIGLVMHYGDWFYVEGGQLNWGYVGLCEYNDKLFYIEYGRLNWGYTGTVLYNGVWWYVENGIAVRVA